MTIELPKELAEQVKLLMHFDGYKSELAVIRDALIALKREVDLKAIREGIEDYEAGRYRPWEEVDAELREKYGMKPRNKRKDD